MEYEDNMGIAFDQIYPTLLLSDDALDLGYYYRSLVIRHSWNMLSMDFTDHTRHAVHILWHRNIVYSSNHPFGYHHFHAREM